MTYKKTSKIDPKFYCEFCDFECSKKGDYNRHILTDKHKNRENTYPKNIITSQHKMFFCECGKKYKHNQSLYNHKKKMFFYFRE